MPVRKAHHAGSWYKSNGPQLRRELENWLDQASSSHSPARAIIAPHAGYSYCGPCGGYAYKQVDPSNIKRVFILGPSHHVYMSGCALSSTTHYQTPLYDLEIDLSIYSDLQATGKFKMMSQQVDEEEHSIEMHLPYVAKVMESRRGKFTIVPVLVGDTSGHRQAEYGKIFGPYLADPENLFVISSDFCHWGKRYSFTAYDKSKGPIHASIEAMDRAGMECITSLDSSAFADYLEKTRNTICGRHPIAVLLNAVEHLKSCHSELSCSLKFVKYTQSSRCTSMSDSSVSYASAALTITPK